MVTKLSSVAALLGVIGAIGAGFVQYGKLTAKIVELDNRKAVINQTVDLTPIEERISLLEVDLIDRINKIKPQDLSDLLSSIQEVREKVAGLPKPANLKPVLNSLKELEEYAWELEEDIEELSKDVAVVKKENELQNILIEEVKALNSNPLGG
jgi:predicted  nucleic acid-binding Zn-ribbon protein